MRAQAAGASEASGGGRSADWKFGQKYLGITTWYRKGGQPGVADDGPAINRAIAACDHVVLRKGSYLSGTVRLRS